MTSGQRRERVMLAGIVLLGLAVRIWGIDFGLPNEHARPDERHLIGFTLTMGGQRLNPGFFNYPSLYLNVLLTFYIGYYVLGRLFGRFHGSEDLVAEYAVSPEAFYLIDRTVVAVLGTATVVLAYAIMKRAAGARAGLLAALFLALSYIHVRDSHFGTVDVPLTFMCTLAVLLMQRAFDAPSLKADLLAALSVGLAISTKYNAVVLGLPLALLHLQRLWSPPPAAQRLALPIGLAGAALAVLVGFVVGTPYSVLDFATFSRDVVAELVDKGRARPPLDLGPGFLYHARFTLPHGVGWPLLLAALFGAVAALRADLRRACLLLGFPVGWYLVVGQSHYIFVRYALPLAPSICLFAAWGVELFARALPGLQPRLARQVPAIAGGLAFVLVFAPTYNLVRWDRLLSRADTRVEAARWVEQQVPSGESVGFVGPQYIRPDLWSTPEQMERASNQGSTGRGRGLRNAKRIEYLAKSSKPSFDLRAFQAERWVDVLNPDAPKVEPPTFVIMAEHPAWRPNPGDLPVLSEEYRPVATFAGFSPQADAVFDLHDAVYAPYAGFRGTERPGPNLTVYRRQSAAN